MLMAVFRPLLLTLLSRHCPFLQLLWTAFVGEILPSFGLIMSMAEPFIGAAARPPIQSWWRPLKPLFSTVYILLARMAAVLIGYWIARPLLGRISMPDSLPIQWLAMFRYSLISPIPLPIIGMIIGILATRYLAH